jgi:hypothetical protein
MAVAYRADTGMGNDDPSKADLAATLREGYRAILEAQAAFEQKLKDPIRRRAWELVQAGEEVFWKKRYDDGIRMLEEAAALDSEYVGRVEAYRRTKERELRKGRVDLTRAINRILFPRLQRLGFKFRFDEDGPKWKEGVSLVRDGAGGRQGDLLMGRSKFGKEFGLNVSRTGQDGQIEWLDLRTVGLERTALEYLNQSEADAMLERVAVAFEGSILDWLDAADPSDNPLGGTPDAEA